MNNKIQMVDLYEQYLSIKEEMDQAISSVIKDSAFIGGKYVDQFETELAKYCRAKFAVGLNSGTDALYLALRALGIKDGDEVITPSFTFFATSEAVIKVGATPVFIDIDPETFNIDTKKIEEKITPKTKVILPVHLFGRPANMEEIMELAKKHSLFVVEDACQAIGSSFGGQKSGTIGDVGCFSFFPSKNLGGYGDGGAIVTNNEKMANKIRMIGNHGSIVKYHNEEIGENSRLDGIQAAILSVKLKHLEDWNKRRREAAQKYTNQLRNVSNIITPEADSKEEYSVFHQYTIRIKNSLRDKLKSNLEENGIPSMIYYPTPLHKLEALLFLNYKEGALPQTDKAASEVLSLPIFPEITDEQITSICDKIKSFLG